MAVGIRPGRWRSPPSLAVVIAALAAILATTAAVERRDGRALVCRCGRVRLWSGTVHGPENSQQLADWYSASHVVHGLLLYAALHLVARAVPVRVRILAAAAIEAGWEMLENSATVIARYRAETVSWGYSGDSVLNSLDDIGFMLAGFVVAARTPAWTSVALAAALELVALAAIRDNLTLNVLMLLHPVAAIRVWQGG